ncbi:FHA domain-containing protein [Crocosphaera subtropica]|uniref:FHA domain-containing protein n=1 Tax=Crocosphaera subtropica TaxID=2546360 RepID=UPI0004678151|nr:FHA domain-containing protein [Crocosphaera subtropica]
MITLTLLHPTKTTPIQSWTFETTATIRIGRSMDNEVVLYSAVVSRHHLEIRYEENHWQVVNLGTNGTYIDGELISQKQAKDGMIIRLASSGPTIQIHLSPEESSVKRQTAQIHQSNSSSSVQ